MSVSVIPVPPRASIDPIPPPVVLVLNATELHPTEALMPVLALQDLGPRLQVRFSSEPPLSNSTAPTQMPGSASATASQARSTTPHRSCDAPEYPPSTSVIRTSSIRVRAGRSRSPPYLLPHQRAAAPGALRGSSVGFDVSDTAPHASRSGSPITVPSRALSPGSDADHVHDSSPRFITRSQTRTSPTIEEELIPRPKKAGNYSLHELVDWSRTQMAEFNRVLEPIMETHLNLQVSFSKQLPESVPKVQELAKVSLPFLHSYENCWPVNHAIIKHLKKTSERHRIYSNAQAAAVLES
ncbi:hypothetical protein ONZ45_g14869 [Pleurotus djamor]|nr:hypothetical protein ONZ45_g14869 [Pleurotus djamor]